MDSSSLASEDRERGPKESGEHQDNPEHGMVLTPDVEARRDRRPSGAGKLAYYTKRFERYLVKYNLETRGLQRVTPQETHAVTWLSYAQAFMLWVSINLAANNITLGMLGPTVYYLSFKDAALCAVFGAIVGSLPVAYISCLGAISGNRTMIFARFTFGWWPSKIIVILNIIVLIGYSLIDLVVAGQILSAVSTRGSLNVVVGIIIVAILCWLISTFGIALFHTFERYAWFPQLIAVSILYGVASKHFDLSTPSQGDSRTVIGNRLSFFSLCLAAAITYSGIAADFFVYYSPSTSRLKLFLASLFGLVISFTLALIAGIGLASGITTNPAYEKAYNTSQGALIVEGLSPLGNFGKFIAILIWLSLVANTIGPSYSIGIDFQILARLAQKIPRFVWNTAGVIIYTVCALAGRNNLAEIFTNFLALMGYWVAIWIAVILEEQLIFRQTRGYDWTVWNEQSKLPIGIAALITFLVGWAGAILCMAQVWYVGPIAGKVGEYGADMGNYVGFSWAALVYAPLRWLELKKFGRAMDEYTRSSTLYHSAIDMKHLTIDPHKAEPPTRDLSPGTQLPSSVPEAKQTLHHPTRPGDDANASLFFVGTATTILEWEGVRIMTDPNFLHAGDHVHLGPGVTGTRRTNPAIDLHELPNIDLVLLSHYHADHFDQHVESSLRRSLPIITTPHAKSHLASKGEGEAFTSVHDLDFFDEMLVDIKDSDTKAAFKVTGMPGSHVPVGPAGLVGKANELAGAVPPTNGWMLELGYGQSEEEWRCSYRIYISGDTLLVPSLNEIRDRYSHLGIDLLLLHLGGTTIPSPSLPLLMVTMDAKQGVELINLVKPDVAIPIHYDDYDVFLSPLSEFQKVVKEAQLESKVVYLDRKDKYAFKVGERRAADG